MALELSSYDLLPQQLPSFARGFAAAFIATVTCYPLDTVRRHIQLQVRPRCRQQLAVGGPRVHALPRCHAVQSPALLLGAVDAPCGGPACQHPVHSCVPRRRCRRGLPPSQAGRSVAWQAAAMSILRDDGVLGLYRGFLPNALKNLPNKGAPRPAAGPTCRTLSALRPAEDGLFPVLALQRQPLRAL